MQRNNIKMAKRIKYKTWHHKTTTREDKQNILWYLLCLFIAQSCRTLCDLMDCSTPVLPVSQSLLRFMSVDSMMPSSHLTLCHQLLILPSIFSSIRVFFNEWIFTSGGQSIRASASASLLLMDIQSWFPLGLTDLMSLQSKGLSRVLSNTTIQKHQFFNAKPCLWSNSHIHTRLLETPQLWLDRPLLAK